MTLFVPLDVEYASDDEFLEAGPLAELLYIRSLCFCKRKMTDGKVKRSQLQVVAGNIPNAAKHAAKLVDVGLWVLDVDGWDVPAYLKRNPSKLEVETERDLAREAGIRGNHERWHVAPDGKPSAKCPICREQMVGSPDRGAKRGRSPVPKPEPVPEPQPEPESSSRNSSTSLREPHDEWGEVLTGQFKRIDDIA